jgi:hypothetical protein
MSGDFNARVVMKPGENSKCAVGEKITFIL